MGIAAIFMPTLIGVLADKWINAEKLYGILHLLYGVCLIILGQEYGKEYIFWIMLFSMFFYMPTIALSNPISFSILKRNNLNGVKTFPVIRVWDRATDRKSGSSIECGYANHQCQAASALLVAGLRVECERYQIAL